MPQETWLPHIHRACINRCDTADQNKAADEQYLNRLYLCRYPLPALQAGIAMLELSLKPLEFPIKQMRFRSRIIRRLLNKSCFLVCAYCFVHSSIYLW